MKRYLVTGGSNDGYAQAITRRLLSDGATVLASTEPSKETEARAMASEFELMQVCVVDHSDAASVRALASEAASSSLDGVVNAEFHFGMEDPNTFDLSEWNRSLAVNLTCPQILFHELRKKLVAGSSFVTVTSTEGFVGSFGATSYAATKAAIHNLVQSHANLGGGLNIRSNAVAAGWIGGVMDTDEVFNMSRKITPLGRLGDAGEVASAVLFLLSNNASFVNGTVLTVDGGYRSVDTISKFEFETEFGPVTSG